MLTKFQGNTMTRGKFIKFYGEAFINGRNVAIHAHGPTQDSWDDTFLAVAEDQYSKELGARIVTRHDLETLPGNHAGRTLNLIESVIDGTIGEPEL